MYNNKASYKAIYDVIMANMKLLKKPGVLTARPGYKITGGKVIYKPAIIVTVVKKKKGLPAKRKLPAEIGDIPVDVRQASPMQLLRQKDPDSFNIIQALGPRELHEPQSTWECDMKTGMPVAPPSARVKSLTVALKNKKTQVKYTPPANSPLNPVQGKMNITAYASPDDGFTVLSSFIKNTTKNLSIGMYDFTSGDLLNVVTSSISGKKLDFKMVLDHPPLNETANQTDEQTHDQIIASDKNASINWALDNMSPEVTGEIFPHAYHIKVVVKDKSSLWLSSGNFNVSNQPNFSANNPKRGSFQTSDRDWHVIVENNKLAQLFESYLQNDFAVAGQFQATAAQVTEKKNQLAGAKAQRKILNSAMTKLNKQVKAVGAAASFPFINPPSILGKKKEFKNVTVSIQPVLTPDIGKKASMYIENILALIKSATVSVFVQMQYITPPPKTSNDFDLLINALGDAFARGLDVRIIVSQFQKDIATEQLATLKLDQVLRKQNRVHNKGIIIDGKKVLVSSQNWSSEGVMSNRDAGLIIENTEIASYFEAIFKDDWTTRAK
jgi:hypothetical protein